MFIKDQNNAKRLCKCKCRFICSSTACVSLVSKALSEVGEVSCPGAQQQYEQVERHVHMCTCARAGFEAVTQPPQSLTL